MSAAQWSLQPAREQIVLYFEDDDPTAYLFRMALEDAGLRIRLFRVTNGQEGLAFLRRQGVYKNAPTPDLVILDLNLPKLSGFEVLASLHASAVVERTPVVILSSSNLSEDKERASSFGARAFFVKPNDWEGFRTSATTIASMLPVVPATMPPDSE